MVLYQGLFPGRLVTLMNLFINYDSDASVTARTRDYDTVFTYIDQNQLLGLGPGTFLPSVYLQLDNQILKFILEGGLIGTTAVVLVYVTSVRLSQAVRRLVPDEETRQLALALSAIVVGAGVTCFTFDAFSFSFYPGVLFIVFGSAGALWRLTLKDYL
jgi:O-antigen ligase